MVFVQYLFGIRSMRQTIKEIETNVAYRWFLGYGFTEKIPHFSTFGKNYVRRFQGTDLFEQIFYRILEEAMNKRSEEHTSELQSRENLVCRLLLDIIKNITINI